MVKGRGSSNTDGYIYSLEFIKNREIENEIDRESEDYYQECKEEYQVCSFFGCGKRLRLEETLARTRCANHLKK